VLELWREFEEGRAHWSRPWALVAYSSWRDELPHLRNTKGSIELTATPA
jgi:hypothetical protein